MISDSLGIKMRQKIKQLFFKKVNFFTKATTFILTFTILFTGCGNTISSFFETKWIDSDIDGTITADTEVSLKDDFAAAVNKDWIIENEKGGSFYDAAKNVIKKKRSILSDKSLTGKGITELRKYTELAEDVEKRQSQGVEPLKEYIDTIGSISNIDQLYDYFCDPIRNPLSLSPLTVNSVGQSPAEPSVYMVYLNFPEPSLGNSEDTYYQIDNTGLEKAKDTQEFACYVLNRLGYSKNEALKLVSQCFTAEQKMFEISGVIGETELKNNIYTLDDLKQFAGTYPIDRYLESIGYSQSSKFFVDKKYLASLNSLCKATVAEMKAYLIVHYILFSANYLDTDTEDTFSDIFASKTQKSEPVDISNDEKKDKMLFSEYIGKDPIMTATLNELYIDKYTNDVDYDELYGLVEDIIEEYHTIFNNEQWMSDESKAMCIEKLDAMKIHILKPERTNPDLYGCNIVPKAEGGIFLDAVFESKKASNRYYAELSTKKFDRSYWDPYDLHSSTTVTNAFYSLTNNGIYILAGLIEAPIYHKGMTIEELYANIGTTTGHEITHGFDSEGVRYNKDGLETPWMSDDDRTAFTDKADNVAKYYSSIAPFENSGIYNGSNVSAEATADMGGIKVTLSMAEKIPDFDFDAYFRAYARLWRTQNSLEEEQYLMNADSHPLSYLRINVGLQQFEKFYEVYDIKENDGMYLSEEMRIAVW